MGQFNGHPKLNRQTDNCHSIDTTLLNELNVLYEKIEKQVGHKCAADRFIHVTKLTYPDATLKWVYNKILYDLKHEGTQASPRPPVATLTHPMSASQTL